MKRYMPIVFGLLHLVLTGALFFLILVADPAAFFSIGYLLFFVLLPGLGVPVAIVRQRKKTANASRWFVLTGCGISMIATFTHFYFVTIVGYAI